MVGVLGRGIAEGGPRWGMSWGSLRVPSKIRNVKVSGGGLPQGGGLRGRVPRVGSWCGDTRGVLHQMLPLWSPCRCQANCRSLGNKMIQQAVNTGMCSPLPAL